MSDLIILKGVKGVAREKGESNFKIEDEKDSNFKIKERNS